MGSRKLSTDLAKVSRVNRDLRSAAQEYLYHCPAVRDFSLWSLIKILLSDPDKALQIREVQAMPGPRTVLARFSSDTSNMVRELRELVQQTTPPNTMRLRIERAIRGPNPSGCMSIDRPWAVQQAIFIATLLRLAPNLESAQFGLLPAPWWNYSDERAFGKIIHSVLALSDAFFISLRRLAFIGQLYPEEDALIENAIPIIAAAPNLEAIHFSFCGDVRLGFQLPPMENLTELSLHHTGTTTYSLAKLLAVVGPRLRKFRFVPASRNYHVSSTELLRLLARWKGTLKELSYKANCQHEIFDPPGLNLLRGFETLESLCTQIVHGPDPRLTPQVVLDTFSSMLPYPISKLRLRGEGSILAPAMQGLLNAFRAGHYSHLRTINIWAWKRRSYQSYLPLPNSYYSSDEDSFDQDTTDEDTSDDENAPDADGLSQSELQAIAASFEALGVDFVLEFLMWLVDS